MLADIFLHLPPATVLLVVSSLLGLTRGHAFPRQTTTLDYHLIDAVAWPLQPTPAPYLPNDLLRRQDLNTICGFIGGDPALPATCLAGSHCVLDREHGAVGCCPDGEAACTTGVFTGCVDFNSGPQTVVNPYVFTCGGSDVCFRNMFDGGFSQFGCGTSSDLATSVATSGLGLTASLPLTAQSVPFTASPTTLSTPTTINPSTGTRPFTQSTSASRSTTSTSTSSSSRSSTTSSRSSTSSVSTTGTSASSTNSSSPTEAPPAPAGTSIDRTGAIIGGTISGVAILIALIAVGIYLWRRKKGNTRQGPGQLQVNQYISPVTGGPQFAPLYPNQQPGQQAGHYGIPPYGGPYNYDNGGQYAQMSNVATPGAAVTGVASEPLRYHPAYSYPSTAGGAVAVGSRRGEASDEVPLTREIDDFSRGFNDALERIGEEPEGPVNGNGMNNGYNGSGSANGSGTPPGSGSGTGNGEGSSSSTTPLWQQNRRQSRNLMWQ